MDPLSALSLAANIIQFVDFTFGLLNSTHEIHGSISGTSKQYQDLGDVHTKLLEFSTQLKDDQSLGAGSRRTQNESQYAAGLKETAEACSKDCERLLQTVDNLKIKSGTGKRWWQSFSKAILEVWAAKDVDLLRSRIDERRTLIVLKLCAISG